MNTDTTSMEMLYQTAKIYQSMISLELKTKKYLHYGIMYIQWYSCENNGIRLVLIYQLAFIHDEIEYFFMRKEHMYDLITELLSIGHLYNLDILDKFAYR